MNRGYVKLWRKSIDGGWLSNHKLWTFWCWCLMKASHKEYDLVVGCQRVHLMPGDFIFGLNQASRELKISVRSIRTVLNRLKIGQNLTLQTTNKFSIISIVNWATYQSDEIENDKQNDKLPTSYRQATDNKQTHKNVKNTTHTPEFDLFWSVYPRKVAKGEAWKAWTKQNGNRPAIEIILATIEKWKQTDQWQKDNGQFIPHPATWINSERWHDDPKIQIVSREEAWKSKIPFIAKESP